MPRKQRILDPYLPHEITNRFNNKMFLKIPRKELWEICCDYLFIAQKLYPVDIHCFLMMDNHYHLLLTDPEMHLDEFMRAFQTEFVRYLNHKLERTDHIFGGRYKNRLLKFESSYNEFYRYVARNPISANICKRVEEYPFSTIYTELGFGRHPITTSDCGFDYFGIENGLERLKWFNTEPEPEVPGTSG